jgi:hypothetical protein
MYICNNCGETFTEFEQTEEYHPYGNGYAAEKWAVCPYCKSNNFDEAKKCKRCGEYVAELKEGLCDCCYGELYE